MNDYADSDTAADYDFGTEPQVTFDGDDDEKTAHFPATSSSAVQAVSTTPVISPYSVTADMDIMIEDGDGVLKGNLTWVANTADEMTGVVYTVTWRRQSCQMHESLPACHLPQQQLVSMVEQIDNQVCACNQIMIRCINFVV